MLSVYQEPFSHKALNRGAVRACSRCTKSPVLSRTRLATTRSRHPSQPDGACARAIRVSRTAPVHGSDVGPQPQHGWLGVAAGSRRAAAPARRPGAVASDGDWAKRLGEACLVPPGDGATGPCRSCRRPGVARASTCLESRRDSGSAGRGCGGVTRRHMSLECLNATGRRGLEQLARPARLPP